MTGYAILALSFSAVTAGVGVFCAYRGHSDSWFYLRAAIIELVVGILFLVH